MNIIASTIGHVRSLAARFLHRDELEAELEAEFQAHVQFRADDLERQGMSRAAAEWKARVEFGGHARFKEEARDSVAGRALESVLRDVNVSLRQLRRSPSFTVAAVVTLAVAIGANAVVFGAINGFILRPLGLPGEERLFTLERTSDHSSAESYPNYVDLRDRNRSFTGLASHNVDQAWVGASGAEPERASFYEVSSNYFDVLGVRPQIGQVFHAADEHGWNSIPYVVLSDAYWHTRFAADPHIVGHTLLVNRQPLTVLGIAQPGFGGSSIVLRADFFLPMVDVAVYTPGDDSSVTNRGNRAITIVGRLKDGVTPRQAAADLSGIGKRLEAQYPKDDEKMTYRIARSGIGAGTSLDQPVQAFLVALMVLAGLILLAACANLGSLFSARAADRAREIALRLAIGASTGRIVRQLLTEAIVVALIGGAVGLWGSVMVLNWLGAWHPFAQFPLHIPVDADARVYGAALGLSVLSGLLFGTAAVRQVLRTPPNELVKTGAQAMRRRMPGRHVLLSIQVAICAVLITSSIVAVRGLLRTMHGRFGFDPHDVLLVDTDLLHGGYTKAQLTSTQQRMLDAMQSIPGVDAVGLIGGAPPAHLWWANENVFAGDATDLKSSNAAADPLWYAVSPGYFRVARTALVAGRDFTNHDDADAPRVAVVNLEFARTVFGSAAKAVGKYFKFGDGTRIQVVGLVQDGKYTANLAEAPQPAMFLPLAQRPMGETFLLVRSPRDVQELSSTIRAKLREMDPGLPSFIQTWNHDLEGALFTPRLAAVSLGVLGAMGALVAISGIFGMAAYSLSKRLKELGIRVALGAKRGDVLRAALGGSARLLGIGSIAGVVLGVLASRVLASIVYEATPRDPLVLAGAVAAMFVFGVIAMWVPARRALAVDPAVLLKAE